MEQTTVTFPIDVDTLKQLTLICNKEGIPIEKVFQTFAKIAVQEKHSIINGTKTLRDSNFSPTTTNHGYKTIIRLKDKIPDEMLPSLSSTIESAFINREGHMQNLSNHPREFVFYGDERYYGCLDLGMLALSHVPGFLDGVQSWEWIDEDPDECCDMLEVFAQHPI